MKVSKIKIDWAKEWANNPRIKILLSDIPSRDSLVYEQIDDLFFAEKEGFVNFFYYKRPGDGYGGSHFTITLSNGERKTLIGPWSSDSYAMNRCFPHSVGCAYTDSLKTFERGYTFTSGHLLVDFVQDNLHLCDENIELKAKYSGGDIIYVPVLANNPCSFCYVENMGNNSRCKECGHKIHEVLENGTLIEPGDRVKEAISGSLSGEQSMIFGG